MSRNFGIVRTAEIALPITAGTMKTLAQLISPGNWSVVVFEIAVGFDLTTATNQSPNEFQLARQTTAGTMTAFTPLKLDSRISDTLQSSGQVNATAEPTLGDLLDSNQIESHSSVVIQYPPLKGEIIMPGSTRVGLLVANGATAAMNARSHIKFEE